MPNLINQLKLSLLVWLLCAPSILQAVSCEVQNAALLRLIEPHKYSSVGPSTGIEFEGSLPANVSLQQVASKIKANLQTLTSTKTEISIRTVDDFTTVILLAEEGETAEWRVEHATDVNVSDSARRPLEVVSPILRTKQDYNIYESVMAGLFSDTELDIRAEPNAGGIHVNIEVRPNSIYELLLLERVFAALDKQLRTVWPVSAGRETYVADPAGLDESGLVAVGVTKDWMDILLDAELSRDSTLNLSALYSREAVEVRLFNSTANLEDIKVMTEFSRRLVGAILSKHPQLIDHISGGLEHMEIGFVARILNIELTQNGHQILGDFFTTSNGYGIVTDTAQKQETALTRSLRTNFVLNWIAINIFRLAANHRQ